MQQTLFLMYGYPGSGKSTFSRQLSEAHGISRISSDDLRTYMWQDAETSRSPENASAIFGAIGYMTERLLEADKSVLYDINCNKRKQRRAVASTYGVRTVVIWVQTSADEARTREMSRTNDPEYMAIPPERYDELVGEMEDPGEGETVIRIDGLASFDAQLQSFDEQLGKIA